MTRFRMSVPTLALLTIWLGAGCASASRDWATAREVDEVREYQRFLDRHPKSEQAAEARRRIDVLRPDQAIWEEAKKEGTAEAYERFAALHAASPYAQRAGSIAAEWRQDQAGRDLLDAVEQGKVQVQAKGFGGALVSLRIRRTVDRPLRIVVPVGTFFNCRGAAQDMVTLAAGTVDLEDRGWTKLLVLAACVDLMKPVPRTGDTFTVVRSAVQKDLRKLMDGLRREALEVRIISADGPTGQLEYVGPAPAELLQIKAVCQAAVWIAAGNASYARMGILRHNPSGGRVTRSSPRTIDETAAARAMQMLDRAGIDITRKAIWRDRPLIARGVSDPGLRGWLERQ